MLFWLSIKLTDFVLVYLYKCGSSSIMLDGIEISKCWFLRGGEIKPGYDPEYSEKNPSKQGHQEPTNNN